MNPLKSDNIVARILQVYAYLNVLGGLVLAFQIGDATTGAVGWGFFSLVLVVSFLLFAFGEVIDLLHQIKTNTHKAAGTAAAVQTASDKASAPAMSSAPQTTSFYNKPVTKPATGSGWTCSCGRVNATYVSSCVCGKSKFDK